MVEETIVKSMNISEDEKDYLYRLQPSRRPITYVNKLPNDFNKEEWFSLMNKTGIAILDSKDVRPSFNWATPNFMKFSLL